MYKENNKGEEMSELRLADKERQLCEVWTRRCHGISSPCV